MVIETAVQAQRQVFKVADLTRNIRFVLEDSFSNVWVEGEVSNFKFHTSGHMYFSLKDEEAQISCVMFRQSNTRLDFEMQDGLKVLCYGRVSVYGPRGQYQLYVERIEPKGVGALQLAFEQLKQKLGKEGLFDAAHKKEIPFLPERVAVVTSIDGAALKDILNVLSRRFSNAHILIYPVPVQGKDAAPKVAEALDDLNQWKNADVVILARGGGSLEDLWAFNEEQVARAIFASRIPVITGIGHEVDFTIADFVADLRAPTPSAAAELVLPKKEDLLSEILTLKNRLAQSLLSEITTAKERLSSLVKSRALRDPLLAFNNQRERLDEIKKRVDTWVQTLIKSKAKDLTAGMGRLEALSPLASLKRGFSISMRSQDMKVVVSAKALKVGDRVRTVLHSGSFVSEVKEIQE